MMTSPGGYEGYTAMAGPTWRNEVCARVVLEVAFNRPIRFASRLRTPLLVQVGEYDSVAPPAAAKRTAARAGQYGEVQRYPVDHFDVYDGPHQQAALADQIEFLGRHLAGRTTPITEEATRS